MWRAAARAVMKRDFTTVVSAVMNSSIGNSTAFFVFPYSLARGPVASTTISILLVCFTMLSMQALTAASSRASITAMCASRPVAVEFRISKLEVRIFESRLSFEILASSFHIPSHLADPARSRSMPRILKRSTEDSRRKTVNRDADSAANSAHAAHDIR